VRTILPVAKGPQVRRYAWRLARRHRGPVVRMTILHALAAATGLVTPWLIGTLVQQVEQGTGGMATVDRIALAIAGSLLVQAVLVRYARLASAALGEQALAEIREEFVTRTLALPLSTVERAGTGDLLTRSSRDVNTLRDAVRYAAPEILIGVVTAVLTAVALVLVSPLLAALALVGSPLLVIATRWYLRRAPAGYLRENASYAEVNEGLAATVDGAGTVEALGLGPRRHARADADCARSYQAERYTMFLRTVWYPVLEVGFLLPVVAMVGFGGWAYLAGWATLAQVTAATLYVQLLIHPLTRVLDWLDHLQVGAAGLARVLGVAEVPPDRAVSGRRPAGQELAAREVRYAYRDGRDVLHGVSVALRPGERLAMVGPSGAGKSTLGRLLAGIEPPRTGEVTVGAAPLVELPLDELRGHVALLTQEHHVFAGTVRDNVVLARPAAGDEQVRAALAAVDAGDWLAALPDGLDTKVGAGSHTLSPAQAQQLALARLVLADPHTLVLDEATSLLDPRAARHLERSLAAVLHGRTVVAIAHRLHTAHDADRVAVVADGRIAELGSHAELVAAGGEYAALWHSWHGDPAVLATQGQGVNAAGSVSTV
jgi:ABC-type multidrug transport system fused ATPase/permease subunit